MTLTTHYVEPVTNLLQDWPCAARVGDGKCGASLAVVSTGRANIVRASVDTHSLICARVPVPLFETSVP